MRILSVIIGCLVLLIATAFVVIVQPGSSGVVASLRLADGSEYMVTQRCNWSPEPYTVAFYMRSRGGNWGWCYIDHQASRWRDVSITYDTNTDVVTVTERGTWQAALDRKRGSFAIGDGKPKRDVPAPQEYREPEFPFPWSNPPPAPLWYSLSPNERLVTEMTLAPQQVTNIIVQSAGKIILGFKTDVPVSYAAQNRDTYVTLKSTDTFESVSSGIGAATRFDGSPDGIHLQVSSDFSFPVRVAIYQETTP